MRSTVRIKYLISNKYKIVLSSKYRGKALRLSCNTPQRKMPKNQAPIGGNPKQSEGFGHF